MPKAICAAAIFVSACTFAQTNNAPANPGLLNEFLRTNSAAFNKWDLGGQLRARAERREYFAAAPHGVDFSATGDPNNSILLLRERIHVGYTPVPWISAFVEGRDSSSQMDDRDPNTESDSMDLQQGYLRLGGTKELPLSLKIGRQEMSYGEQLLIGPGDWGNIPRSFDAAKLRYEQPAFSIDAFVARRVIPRANAFNQNNEHENFSGVYAAAQNLLPHHNVQAYLLARNVDSTPSHITVPLVPIPTPRDIYTAGGRIESSPQWSHGWDYNVEGAYQFGRFRPSFTAASQTQNAFATHLEGGYSWKDVVLSPRVGIEYNFASGDNNPTDGAHRTFDNLYPSNHRPFGMMDFVSWQNIHDVCLTTLIHPIANLSITNEVHGFWLADSHDFFYQSTGAARTSGGYGIKSGAGQFVGSEYDFLASYNALRCLNFQLGYGHFFVGEYVRNSLAPTGGAKDADWFYAQVTFNF
ncbi:MAG: hypothetical protein JWO95_691 [Verrucomicrobiales bacterium]|nr:hypothetical protein [Verrucomicrobiales bacterium]